MDMLIQFVIILIIAGICGGIAQAIFGMQRTNFLISMAIGVMGAYLGTYLAQRFGWPSILLLPIGTMSIELVWAMAGSLLLVFVLSLLNGARPPSRRRRSR